MSELMKAAALVVEVRRALALEGDAPRIVAVVDAQVSCGGFLEEGARPCRAGLVHGVVDGTPLVRWVYLASWPPISKIVSTSGSKWAAPVA